MVELIKLIYNVMCINKIKMEKYNGGLKCCVSIFTDVFHRNFEYLLLLIVHIFKI
jgi:hypothetical protein